MSLGKQTISHGSIERLSFPFDALLFLRVTTLSDSEEEEVDMIIDELRSCKNKEHHQGLQGDAMKGENTGAARTLPKARESGTGGRLTFLMM